MTEQPAPIVRTASGRQILTSGLVDDDEGAPTIRLQSSQESLQGSLPFQTPSIQSSTLETPDWHTPLGTPIPFDARSGSMAASNPYLNERGTEEVEEPRTEAQIHDPNTSSTLPALVPVATGQRQSLERDTSAMAGTQYTTRESVNREHFEPISVGDDQRLRQLARTMSRPNNASTRRSSVASGTNDLERRDTLYGLEKDDPVFDPSSDKFDLYKWLKMSLRIFDESGITLARAGVVWKNLSIYGKGAAVQTQPTLGSILTSPLRIGEAFQRKPSKQILHHFNGIVKSGEMLIVLGRPGSGCSTLLKTLTGEQHGLQMDSESHISYNGVPQKQMLKEFKGEVIYNQEVDKHFPHLTVSETLEHATACRVGSKRPDGVSRKDAIAHVTKVVMAVYGLSHTNNTKVGNDFVRGVSGGERKRVSIAEMAIAGASVLAWDNSTRGLDAASALSFTKSLRQSANLTGSAELVAVYQASQDIYDLFDRAVVLYEGRCIFFGYAREAKAYFEKMGWVCPSRQTTGDFLTSVTNPVERVAKEGFDAKVPRTPEDFEKYWLASPEYENLMREIHEHEQEFPIGNEGQLTEMRTAKQQQQADHVRPKSSYIISLPMQVRLNGKRAWRRIVNDKAATFTPLVSNIVLALIIGSVFYGTPQATAGFQSFGAALFFAILLAGLSSISEITSLYEQRPIVEKHKSYAFYRPMTEAIAGIAVDIPLKFLQSVVFNLILYFLVGLKAEPGAFFLFFLTTYLATFTMSGMFRTLAALTKTVAQAMSLAGILILAIVIYTGFVVPIPGMKVWFSWIRWINPIFYAFEILVANEFHGVRFACSQLIPPKPIGDAFVCSVRGSRPGELTVLGDDYIRENYSYSYDHVWRNVGILFAFLFAFMAIYFVSVELNSSTSSTAEVLVFKRGHVPAHLQNADSKSSTDEENVGGGQIVGEADEKEAEAKNVIPPQKDIFTWRGVNYDITIKGEPRRLLDNVAGWVKPGQLTALMGTSGAGKTTLLDVLAQRTSMGVVTGNMFVNGAPLDSSFQRKTGYVQQQDLHLETATVRESLRFSAMLRQPNSVSKKEKFQYVEDVIKMLKMEDFAEAVVGIPGQGLNVEQRKLLTIGVELAAKPKLLLFLDEPSSGLDSQSSWAIIAFLRKLADAGQAVLCTIHQPSAILFQQFDRLLFLRKGGKCVYFGDIGENSHTLLDYFETNGARHCDPAENPAEYMLEIAADEKWVGTWNDSKEAAEVQKEIDSIHERQKSVAAEDAANTDVSQHSEFAMPFGTQLVEVTKRVFQQYWRLPSYIASKFILSGASGLFIGFSFFQANASIQGLSTLLYAVFMTTTSFSSLVQMQLPQFVTQRSLYEVRERPSKAYTWKAFMFANIVVELPYQILAGIVLWATFYFPVVGTSQSGERIGLVLIYDILFFVYASTFAHFVIAALPDAQTGGAVVTLLFSMTLIFSGVMQSLAALPGFWTFMYWVSPLTYWISGIVATLLHERPVTCATEELNIFNPPPNTSCGQYLLPYASQGLPGTLSNPGATSNCEFCSLSVADQFLAPLNISWSNRWRNVGIFCVYIVFNIFAAIFLYYIFRVWPLDRKAKTKTRTRKSMDPKQTIEKSEPDDYETSSQEAEPTRQENLQALAELPAITPTSTARQRPRGGLYRQMSEQVDGYLDRNARLGKVNTKNANVF